MITKEEIARLRALYAAGEEVDALCVLVALEEMMAERALWWDQAQRAAAAETRAEKAEAWEVAGRLAWSVLTETAPDDATPDGLLAEARAIDDAVCAAGCSAHRVPEDVTELRARAEKAEAMIVNQRHEIGMLTSALEEWKKTAHRQARQLHEMG
jgi:hypothetical protein